MRNICARLILSLVVVGCTSTSVSGQEDDFAISSVVCPRSNSDILEIYWENSKREREIVRIWYNDGVVSRAELGVAEAEGAYSYWARVDTKTQWFVGPGETEPIDRRGKNLLAAVTKRGAEVIKQHCPK